jgi:hypothetical protein
MSRYEVGRLFFDACRDRDMKLVLAYSEDPEAVLAHYDLTEAERRQVLSKDIRAIYESGVPPLLVRMGVNAFMPGTSTPAYKDMIAGAVQVQD